MKRELTFLIVVLGLLIQFSCKEDQLDFYEATPSVYFPENQTVGRLEGRDIGHYSFGYVSAFVDHYIKKIPVRVTGPIVDYEREYRVEVADTSSMLAQKDYVILNEKFVIRANQYSDTIYLKILRSEGLKKGKLNIGLQLLANNNFETELNHQIVGTGETMRLKSLLGYNFSADDMAGAPWFWDPAQAPPQAKNAIEYLGPFSNKKFQIMIGRFELDVEPMLKEKYFPATGLLKAWVYGMQAYFAEMEALGTPVLEENGQRMRMGTKIQ